jgi:hypothetical protein
MELEGPRPSIRARDWEARPRDQIQSQGAGRINARPEEHAAKITGLGLQPIPAECGPRRAMSARPSAPNRRRGKVETCLPTN